MANGKLKPASEYFNDTETYTGAGGGSTNPLCVEDVFDLVSIRDATFYLMLVNDIDFNDHKTYRYGLTASDIIIARALNGNNHNIYNMIFDSSGNSCVNIKDISDTNFINLIFKNVAASLGAPTFRASFSRCNFGMFVVGSDLDRCIFNTDYSVSDCSFNIRGNLGSKGLAISAATYRRCHFNLDISLSSGTLIQGSADNNRAKLYDCGITGFVKYGNYNTYTMSFTSWYNSYVALETPGAVQKLSNSSADKVSFMVTGIGKTPELSASGLQILTEQQAKDPEYLQSIGFLTL